MSMTDILRDPEPKDTFYEQFDYITANKPEYDMKPLFDNMTSSEAIQGDHLPVPEFYCTPGASTMYVSAEPMKEERFECELCDKTFKHKHSLTEHAKQKHQNFPVSGSPCAVIEFVCNFCEKVFAGSHALNRHLVIHTGGPKDGTYTCREQNCSRIFNTENQMRLHIDQDHRKRRINCKVCGKSFNRVSNLNRHMKLHQNIREFPCRLCSKAFTQRAHRYKHMMIHFRASNRCPKCDSGFTELKYFDDHISNVCNITFDEFGHTSMVAFPECPPMVTKTVCNTAPKSQPLQPVKFVKCPICSVEQTDLRSHIIECHHIDNICPQCNKNHTDFNALVRHLGECKAMFYSSHNDVHVGVEMERLQ